MGRRADSHQGPISPPPSQLCLQESEAQFKVNAKGQLVVQLAAGSADPEAAADAAKALRRRIELVVPAVY